MSRRICLLSAVLALCLLAPGCGRVAPKMEAPEETISQAESVPSEDVPQQPEEMEEPPAASQEAPTTDSPVTDESKIQNQTAPAIVTQRPEGEQMPAPTGQPPESSQPQEVRTTVIHRTLGDRLRFFTSFDQGNLNIRAEPSHSSALLASLDESYWGMDFLIFLGDSATGPGSDGMDHTWYRVCWQRDPFDSQSGWVRSDYLQEISVDAAYSSEKNPMLSKFWDGPINVRSQPGSDSSLVCTVSDWQTPLYPLFFTAYAPGSDGASHQWLQVSVDGDLDRIGWVRADYTNIELNGTGMDYLVKVTPDPLKVRSEPSHNSALVATIETTDPALAWDWETGEGPGSDGLVYEWYRVYGGNYSGWVRSDLVEVLY